MDELDRRAPAVTGFVASRAPLSKKATFPSDGKEGEAETLAVRFTA